MFPLLQSVGIPIRKHSSLHNFIFYYPTLLKKYKK